jgi:hypothetical protein
VTFNPYPKQTKEHRSIHVCNWILNGHADKCGSLMCFLFLLHSNTVDILASQTWWCMSSGLWSHLHYRNEGKSILYTNNRYKIHYSTLEYTITIEISPWFQQIEVPYTQFKGHFTGTDRILVTMLIQLCLLCIMITKMVLWHRSRWSWFISMNCLICGLLSFWLRH